jgi:hypothetical protein
LISLRQALHHAHVAMWLSSTADGHIQRSMARIRQSPGHLPGLRFFRQVLPKASGVN